MQAKKTNIALQSCKISFLYIKFLSELKTNIHSMKNIYIITYIRIINPLGNSMKDKCKHYEVQYDTEFNLGYQLSCQKQFSFYGRILSIIQLIMKRLYALSQRTNL